MKRFIILNVVIMLYLLSCGDKEPPIVEITNPEDDANVYGTVLVTAEAIDNKVVDSLEIFIDDSLVTGISSKPHLIYMWETDSLTHNSVHNIYAQAYDELENVGISDTVSVTVRHLGTLKWRYYGSDWGVNVSPAIGFDGTIYFGVDQWDPLGTFYALDPDGSLKWYYSTFRMASSPAIGSDGTVYFGVHYGWPDGRLYALNPDGVLGWYYQTSKWIDSSPAIGSDGTIYFGVADSCLHALDIDGTLKWRYQTGNSIVSSPAIGSDGTVYFGSNDRCLYALNSDGTLKWRYQTDGWVESSPAIGSDGTIYFGSGDGFLYALYGSSILASTPWPKFHHDLKNTGRVGG